MTPRVVFVDETANLGGAEFVLLLHATQLRRRGWDAQVIVPGPGPLVDQLRQAGVPVHFAPRPPLMSTSFYVGQRRKVPNPLALVVNALPLLVWLLRLRAALVQLRPDVIHSVSLWSHALAGVAGRSLGVPVIWHFQDLIDPAAGLGLYRRLLLWWAGLWPSRILCVSEAVAAQFAASPRAAARAQVLWNTVDLWRFTPRSESADLGRAGCPLTIGTAARLTPWKGQEVALHTAWLLKAQGVPFHWHFAGSEDLGSRGYQQHLADLTRAWGLAAEVTWHGWVSDMPAFYQQLDVLAHLPLEADPCPLSLTEAMATGLLIIAASGGSADVLVPAAGGELVPPNDPGAAAAQLAAAAQDHALTRDRGLRARRYAEAAFSVESYTDQLVQVYQSLEGKDGHLFASPAVVGDRAGR